jgi:V-type H+-transporting ATPase subunit a
MFGDIGHGGVLLIIGTFLCLFGHKFPALKMAMAFRYILFLMGLCATFCGLVYNDFMSIPI